MKRPDKGDIFMLAGLLLIGGGLWMWLPWVSLTAVGVIILALGFFTPGNTKGTD